MLWVKNKLWSHFFWYLFSTWCCAQCDIVTKFFSSLELIFFLSFKVLFLLSSKFIDWVSQIFFFFFKLIKKIYWFVVFFLNSNKLEHMWERDYFCCRFIQLIKTDEITVLRANIEWRVLWWKLIEINAFKVCNT